jgi:NitT/TauT family transport system ATP-binding protein
MSDLTTITVRVEALGFGFRSGSPVLSDVALTVNQGERVALMGPSGSGKTTLLKIIAGLSGYRTFTGTCERRGHLVMGFQQPLLLNYLTVRDNILLPSRILKDEQEIVALVHSLDLEELLDRYPFQLSGGQQRRVALARDLACPNAGGLLLDEPFSGLDEPLRDRILVKLQAHLSATSLTSIFATHSPMEATFLADRVVFLGSSPATIVAEHVVRLQRAQREKLFGKTPFFEEMAHIREMLDTHSTELNGGPDAASK